MAARELPGGTVTLLFTDIEGSTRMLQELGRDAYVRALTDHRRLLREAFAARGGVEVEMQGDSFFFAFPAARDAVGAAVAGQRALAEHEWDAEPIRVRIGLHTGEPIQADGLYAGLDVHRAARVMSAAHGGQILLSQATADLIQEELDDGVELRDLGEHRLKDLSASQRLFQPVVTGLPSEFPPLTTLASAETNLPVAASPLIGRERELGELVALLANGSRAVTITGTGGSGKTRLALQAAAELIGRFPDGVFWAALAPLTDPALVLPTIAQALGVKDDLGRHLAGRTTLLMLDNFEHVLGASGDVSELLAGAPEVRALVTSRAPLRIDGEHEYALEPLGEAAAVTLFQERSRAVGQVVDASATVTEVCRRLDNLPLTIELAAARTRLLTPQALLDRLDRRLPLLTEGRRDAPERQRTLSATIDWSYELLDGPAQRVFSSLSVFAGSFSLEAAEYVAEADLEALGALANLSLLKRLGDDRLLMLETIREFAQGKSEDASEAARIRRRHVEWYLAVALELEQAAGGKAEAEQLGRVAVDYANVRAALHACVEDGDTGSLLRFASSLQRYWCIRGSPQEGLGWLDRALAVSPRAATRERCMALDAAEGVARVLQDFPRAGELAREWLGYARELNDLPGIATALGVLAIEAQWEGEIARARSLLEEAVVAAREADDPQATGFVLNELGFVSYMEGDFEQAFARFGEAGDISRRRGDDQSAVASTDNMAAMDIELGRHGDAALRISEAFAVSRRLGWGNGSATTLELAGVLLADVAEAESAAVLFGAAAALRDELSTPFDFGFADLYARAQESIRTSVGEARFAELTQHGRSLSVDEAIREAERILQTL